jgi:hypothetical protein
MAEEGGESRCFPACELSKDLHSWDIWIMEIGVTVDARSAWEAFRPSGTSHYGRMRECDVPGERRASY